MGMDKKSLMKLAPLFLVAGTAVAFSLSLAPRDWSITGYGYKKPFSPGALSGGGFGIDLPVSSGQPQKDKWVNYALQYFNNTASIANDSYLTITAQVVVTGAPVFNYNSEPENTCVYPAHLRPYFEAADWGTNTHHRWWANDPYSIELDLTPGQVVTITVPLDWTYWTDVYAGQSQTYFDYTRANIYAIGFTLGGGCFYGHGVNVSGGTAQLQILSYSTF